MFEQEIYQISIWALPVILAITFHEAAHGWMAYRLGDDTAYRLGRVTFHPFRHIAQVGTVLLPLSIFLSSGFVFGWAKPVPVAITRLGRTSRATVPVDRAGPPTHVTLTAGSHPREWRAG